MDILTGENLGVDGDFVALAETSITLSEYMETSYIIQVIIYISIVTEQIIYIFYCFTFTIQNYETVSIWWIKTPNINNNNMWN